MKKLSNIEDKNNQSNKQDNYVNNSAKLQKHTH